MEDDKKRYAYLYKEEGWERRERLEQEKLKKQAEEETKNFLLRVDKIKNEMNDEAIKTYTPTMDRQTYDKFLISLIGYGLDSIVFLDGNENNISSSNIAIKYNHIKDNLV
jgi:hypothetical protein